MPLATAALSLALALGPSPEAALRPADLPMPPPLLFPAHEPPTVNAGAWMAWSVAEAAEIGGLNQDRRVPPASITKLLTAIIAAERADLLDSVTISSNAGSTGIGYVGQPVVRTGEVWLVGQLLENILIQSDNGGAVALAEHVSGSVAAFVALMNQRAAEIGMADTEFANPHGLDDSAHLSTARDLIRLGVEALDHPDVLRAARIKETTFALGARRMRVTATNRDLGIYPGLLGLKTGDTANAGQTILSYTETARGGIIAVVLGSTNRRAATRDVVSWAAAALGPRDYFLAPAIGTDLESRFPSWYVARLRAAGTLDDGGPRAGGHSPLMAEVTARLRELLPALLGGNS